jgi:hypothetical protein
MNALERSRCLQDLALARARRTDKQQPHWIAFEPIGCDRPERGVERRRVWQVKPLLEDGDGVVEGAHPIFSRSSATVIDAPWRAISAL